MPETTGGSLRISMLTPASWVDLDLDPTRREGSVARLVAERTGPDSGPLGAELAELFSRTAAEARAEGAFFASVFSDALDGRPVSASLVASLVNGTGEPAPEEDDDRASLAAGLADHLGNKGRAEVRRLPAGPAARVRGRRTVQAAGRAVEVEVVQYFVPLPGGSQLAMLSFTTPTLALGDAFAELFDAMAETLSWT